MRNIAALGSLPPQSLLSDLEVEALYGLKAGTLRNWRVVGRGPKFLRVGRCVRYRVSSIEEFLAACASENLASGTTAKSTKDTAAPGLVGRGEDDGDGGDEGSR